jgi:hypothetical protein
MLNLLSFRVTAEIRPERTADNQRKADIFPAESARFFPYISNY